MAESLDEFLSETASVPLTIGDAAPPPQQIEGMAPAADPLRPWRDINVDAYVPVAKWALKQPFKFAASKYDPLWELDDEEVESLDSPLTEATQKCLYDLRLSRVAGNPYVALIVGLASLSAAKYMAIQFHKQMAAAEEARRAERERAGPPPEESSSSRPPSPSPPPTSARPNHSGTRRVSSMTNIRTQGSGGASSSAAFQGPANPNSSLIESEPDDE